MDTSTELARRLENLIRLGTVAEVDHAAARCRITAGNLTTNWLAWVALRAGASQDWDPPSIGEQCLVFSPSGDPAQGIALVGIYSEAHPAPANSATVRRRAYPDGALIQYDHASHMLHATLPAGGRAVLEAPAGVLILGNVDITGTVTVSQDVVASGISLVNHDHGGVQPGNGTTGAPQ
ncbi:phage baseplate assembly protein V [Pseudomonas sp. PS02288]|uniref:phage baseplate assembly protein V n=1 Tax=Pseudomonas sp. PS02288 TaxID=2991443 RepID=UPI002499DCE1|nr:phage baseplate assembly protein V [Pseudomonas sp. PS02288]